MDQTGSDWIRLDQTESDWIRLDQIRSDWIGLDQIGSGWTRLDQIGLDWIRLNQMTWGWLEDDLGISRSTVDTLAACHYTFDNASKVSVAKQYKSPLSQHIYSAVSEYHTLHVYLFSRKTCLMRLFFCALIPYCAIILYFRVPGP